MVVFCSFNPANDFEMKQILNGKNKIHCTKDRKKLSMQSSQSRFLRNNKSVGMKSRVLLNWQATIFNAWNGCFRGPRTIESIFSMFPIEMLTQIQITIDCTCKFSRATVFFSFFFSANFLLKATKLMIFVLLTRKKNAPNIKQFLAPRK